MDSVKTIVFLRMQDMTNINGALNIIALPEELHPDQIVDVSYGVCINPRCTPFRSELANGYCVDCWDAGHGFKPNEPTAGYIKTFKRDAQGYGGY